VIFKPSMSAEILDWLTPPQVQVVKFAASADQLERIQQRAKELKEAMGPRYLCHEKNRVRRLDERTYRSRGAGNGNVRAIKRAA
jgi:hypothetical protein